MEIWNLQGQTLQSTNNTGSAYIKLSHGDGKYNVCYDSLSHGNSPVFQPNNSETVVQWKSPFPCYGLAVHDELIYLASSFRFM